MGRRVGPTTERPAEIVRVDLPSGKIHPVTDVNGGIYAQLALPEVEAEWFPASDGQKIHTWVVKPPNFDPSKKYPFLLYCQGGPQSMVGQLAERLFQGDVHALVSHLLSEHEIEPDELGELKALIESIEQGGTKR